MRILSFTAHAGFTSKCPASPVFSFMFLRRPARPTDSSGRVAPAHTGVDSISRVGTELTTQTRPDQTPDQTAATLSWTTHLERDRVTIRAAVAARSVSCASACNFALTSTTSVAERRPCSRAERASPPRPAPETRVHAPTSLSPRVALTSRITATC